MNIIVINNRNVTLYSPLNNNIKSLEKQKAQLQIEIQKITEAKMNDKTKQDRIKQLQEQIQQIEKEIQKKRIENQNTKQNTQTSKSNTADKTDNENQNNLEKVSHLIQAYTSYSQAEVINSVKNRLKGKSNILKIEIKLDAGRGINPEAKKEELSSTDLKKQSLEKKSGEMLKNSQTQAKEASKTKQKSTLHTKASIPNIISESEKDISAYSLDKSCRKIDITV